jgi:hypothetical protein
MLRDTLRHSRSRGRSRSHSRQRQRQRQRSRSLIGGLLAAAGLTLTAAPAKAQPGWWPTAVDVEYSADLPADAVAHGGWRLVASFSRGVSDFLFEVMVLKPTLLPAGRVDPILAEELDYGITGYPRRLNEHLVRALKAEGERLIAEIDQPELTLRMDLLSHKPHLPLCASPRCESLNFADVAGYMLPPRESDSWALSQIRRWLTAFQVAAVVAPSADEQAIIRDAGPVHSATVHCRKDAGCEIERR